jgi:pimeloyl-ACP methyl ester carboxylesterase
MEFRDDDLEIFETSGPTPLPSGGSQGHVENDGAVIWYCTYGYGPAVILLHGGLGNSGNWGYQVSSLVAAGYQVILIDSRGHGRSTRDAKPYSYVLLGSDVLAVMDALTIEKAAIVGWSDGACTGLILGHTHPDRISGVFYFACNMDNSGTHPFVLTPRIERCFSRHKQDYATLSPTPEDFDAFVEAVGLMQRTQPEYSAEDVAAIDVPVTIVQAEHDEFIRREHADYLAHTIPGANFVSLQDVSHFAPVQKPDQFSAEILTFLKGLRSPK